MSLEMDYSNRIDDKNMQMHQHLGNNSWEYAVLKPVSSVVTQPYLLRTYSMINEWVSIACLKPYNDLKAGSFTIHHNVW